VPRISRKNQITLPVDALAAADLRAGDEVTIEAARPGELVVRRARREVEVGLGVFEGLYEPGYLDRLRREDERE
jgi:bifunctional DNA-binding transcriptional regulator/antitoxin component of YhaV-PrlF toxin-antitoxin module